MIRLQKPPAEMNGERGSTLFEFALVSPIFFIFVFAVIELGRIVAQQAAVADALRESSRVASVRQGDCLAAAQERFDEQISRLHFQGTEFLPLEGWREDLPLSGVQVYTLRVRGIISCSLCHYLFRSDVMSVEFHEDYSFPLESRDSC